MELMGGSDFRGAGDRKAIWWLQLAQAARIAVGNVARGKKGAVPY